MISGVILYQQHFFDWWRYNGIQYDEKIPPLSLIQQQLPYISTIGGNRGNILVNGYGREEERGEIKLSS